MHGDLLLFQVGSWASGQVLFAVFGLYALHGTLPHIAFVEVASAFFGTTFASIAFRVGFASASKTRWLIVVRFAVLLVVALAAASGVIAWTWVLGVAPSLLTPAHFPVIYGARKAAVIVLVLARALACVACIALSLSAAMTFAVYFAPGVVYALALYGLHRGDWTRPLVRDVTPLPSASADVFVVLPMASAGLFFMQASIVSGIAAVSPGAAVFERLMRSGYSLAYPYLMRIVRFDAMLRHAVGWMAFVLPVAAIGLRSWPLAAICVPVCIDLVTTNLFRLTPRRLRLLAGWVGVGVLVMVALVRAAG